MVKTALYLCGVSLNNSILVLLWEKCQTSSNWKSSVMVNCLFQLGWAYSRCFCEGGFWLRFTFESVNFEKSKLASIMWVGLIQSVKGLIGTKGWPCKQEVVVQQTTFELYLQHWLFRFELQYHFFPWIFRLLAHSPDLRLASL